MASLRCIMVYILLLGCSQANQQCTASIGGTCPPTWNQWGDKYYKAILEKLPWGEARKECVKMGGVMVTPNSLMETQFLLRITSANFWINCTDIESEGNWQCNWQEGTTDIHYTHWADGQPDNRDIGEHCAVVWISTGEWHDAPCTCDKTHQAICKKPAPMLHF